MILNEKQIEKYLDWCIENDKNPLNCRNFKEFFEGEKKISNEKKEKMKKIFTLMCEYAGKENKIGDDDDDFYEAFDEFVLELVNKTLKIKKLEDEKKKIEEEEDDE